MAQKKRKSRLPLRLNLLFFIIFLLFSVIILRLGYIQIVEGESFQEELEQSTQATAQIDAPRGLMYDRHGNVVVNNELDLSLTYTNTPGNEEERLEVAERLSEYIDMDIERDDLREREMQDYWLQTREEERESLLSDEEIEANQGEDGELYELELERITDAELADIEEDELNTVAIWREMLSGYNHEPHRLKRGLEEEEAHAISEQMEQFPNVDIMTDASRSYPYGESFPNLFGSTGSIPSESLDEYLARGYERSDIIGTTFLEYQYENALRGEKGVREVNRSGGEETVIEDPGSRGDDLILTIDMALQQEIEASIEQEVSASPGAFITDPEAYVVMMEPSTGDVLAMAGYDNQLGVMMRSYEMGSTVKAATVLAGFDAGVVQPGSVINDQPIDLPGAPTLSSWRNFGPINDLKALEVSSNIYMAEIAMRIAGYDGQSFPTAQTARGFQTLRNYYAEFGLGVPTHVDLPQETTGFTSESTNPGNLLDLSFGQYDNYTPLQLAQYISTIANDGYRMEPRLVREIREPDPDAGAFGAVKKQFEPNPLNRISATDNHIDRVQEGLRRVVEGPEGTAADDFEGVDYAPAAKTGTAEIVADGIEGVNQALVGYAPHDDPEVAFAVIVPNVHGEDSGGQSGVANNIARSALDSYFEVQDDRPDPDEADEGTTMEEYQEGEDLEDVEEEMEEGAEDEMLEEGPSMLPDD
ncbi:cell elongation-specific peptidoglycan D,D-transpeptidase [Salsuginibacillus halophilus]|uniref:serine-type D-Ala-D-Ala carboxypeptidase n=1 Tax=Salsuginibacillus halophilus TaxID=517424 RepID=A0A2P8H7V9_9BACI|nr:penicillin-binding transpeptidase domain-containing protein [Salsuginibacillus halophilus]PSL42313.1 cell elongation-specific peptidoglycan D,D-transpeptidase [Salsuginibacillus halophilus]